MQTMSTSTFCGNGRNWPVILQRKMSAAASAILMRLRIIKSLCLSLKSRKQISSVSMMPIQPLILNVPKHRLIPLFPRFFLNLLLLKKGSNFMKPQWLEVFFWTANRVHSILHTIPALPCFPEPPQFLWDMLCALFLPMCCRKITSVSTDYLLTF